MKTIASSREKTKTKGVLIIDGDPRVCRVLQDKFREAGYRAFEASEGQEGLRQAEKHKPDLIVSEVKLPGMSGAEFLRRLRRKDQQTKVIFTVTAPPDIVDVHAMHLEFSGFFEKPFDVEDLLREIRKAIGKPVS